MYIEITAGPFLQKIGEITAGPFLQKIGKGFQLFSKCTGQ